MATVINNAMLEAILAEIRPLIGRGKVADYIPALASVSGDKLGIAISTVDGQHFAAGDAHERFSIQSISKVLSLVVAMNHYQEEEIWQRVGKDPSGQPFNSLLQLEIEQGKPRNPFINAGALVVCDMLQSRLSAPRQRMLEIVRRLSGVADIAYDPVVARSEFEHSARNAAIAWLMKSFGNFHNDVATVLQNYFHYCSLEMSCVELALVLSIALGVAVGGAGSITFPLPALIWCAVRYPLPLTCLLTFLTGIGEILLVANSLIHFSPDARMQPWQLFSTRLGIAAMLISPVIVASSVEAINTLVKQLALRADFDFQTRVYSRSGLSEALKRQTLPADKLLTVMVLDIDGFKRVNDALGHEGGDCVLTQFAQQVRQLVGEQGMVARIGGEEFAVAAVVDSAQQGYLLAEKIRHGVESQPFGLGQNPIHLTISLGLETREVGHARITELFNQLLLAADDEMVKAKQSGRNQICMPTLTESAP